MPTLRIQGNEIPYDEKDIITFPEGLIGLPNLTKMVAVKQSTIDPFIWFAAANEEDVAFVVAEAHSLYPNYQPALPEDSNAKALFAEGETPVVFAIVLIDANWQRSTANLRAPLFVSAKTMRGAQVVLNDNSYAVGEPLPLAAAAA
jgi:flagellar assembly factor FliW